MKQTKPNSKRLRAALLPALAVLTAILLPLTGAYAQEPKKIVRVGWFESPFNMTDELGRRSGYSYDYQQKLATYTGWTYEYVEKSWPELLQMLEDGRIDLLSDVSYTEERSEKMLYSSLPMGSEEYYLFVSPDHTEISPEDYSTFNGKKVGANRNSIQIALFREWSEANGVRTEIVEMSGTEEENLTNLVRGDIDMYLSSGGFFDKEYAIPICRIGASDFYFAVSRSRPDLLVELNNAMNRVQDENGSLNRQLHAKYLQTTAPNRYLSAEENEWLAAHGPVRVGYQDNYLAFCAQDQKTGELTGALKDYLEIASDCLENAHIDFEPVCYSTAEDAMEALKRGDVDCVFPNNLTEYDGEISGVFITPALMRTDMSAVIRESDLNQFASKERVAVAVNAGNPNYDKFLLDHFPEWRAIYFSNTPECLKAIADGQADCLLISNYRFNNISDLCDKYHLTTWSTGVEMDYCFAVNRTDTVLYSILTKTAGAVPAPSVNAALTYYYTKDAGISLQSFLRKNIGILFVLLAAAVLSYLIVLHILRKKKAADRNRMRTPTAEDFRLFDDLPISYSVYHVIHSEHSELYDAEIVYVNHKFEEYGRCEAASVIGQKVRTLYPYIEETWFRNIKRAAMDGETVENVFTDIVSGDDFRLSVRQILSPGYCAVTYMKNT